MVFSEDVNIRARVTTATLRRSTPAIETPAGSAKKLQGHPYATAPAPAPPTHQQEPCQPWPHAAKRRNKHNRNSGNNNDTTLAPTATMQHQPQPQPRQVPPTKARKVTKSQRRRGRRRRRQQERNCINDGRRRLQRRRCQRHLRRWALAERRVPLGSPAPCQGRADATSPLWHLRYSLVG